MTKTTLKISGLRAKIDDKEILKGLNLTIRSGEIHAIMGPNGSGKSTLCNVLMNHPKYEVTGGSVSFNDEDLLEMETDERAHKGLFLAFQHPIEIPGVTFANFLRLAKNANKKEKTIGPADFHKVLKKSLGALKMKDTFAERFVNAGLSGGERKRAEIVQMSILKPKIALLDEIDSGLDIDALRVVAKGINEIFEKEKPAILIITHYQRILNYIKPHFVHIMSDGKIIKSGTGALAHELEKYGYEKYVK